MRIKTTTAALILPLFFILGIGFAIINGVWTTENSKQPAKITTGAMAGKNNPADIRGSYSLGDIENSFDISVEILANAFGVSTESDPSSIQLKEFEESYGEINGLEVGTDSMRLFVARYLGLPYTSEEGTGILRPAYNILKQEGKLSEEELNDLNRRLVAISGFSTEDIATVETGTHDEALDTTTIKGTPGDS